jgi:serine/threonine protein phosphatase PrpC
MSEEQENKVPEDPEAISSKSPEATCNEVESTGNTSRGFPDESSRPINTAVDPTPPKEQNLKKNCTSVYDFGIAWDQNYKHRRRMEDTHYVEDCYTGNASTGFFAVYDGHGGKEAAHFCSQELHKILQKELEKRECVDFSTNIDNVLKSLQQAYLLTDESMQKVVPVHHGCTAVTCLVSGSLQDNSRVLFVANAGDSKAVLCRDKQAILLTKDHKASDSSEADRIIKTGGFIINGRVNGQILITRSLGDHIMKEFIIGEPFLRFEKLTEADTYLIIASDGLWDVMSEQQAVDFLLANANCSASELSKKLLQKAVADGSADNISVITVKL